jgi:hypothetical protein
MMNWGRFCAIFGVFFQKMGTHVGENYFSPAG